MGASSLQRQPRFGGECGVSRSVRMGGAQAPISVLHRAISKRWAPFSAPFANLSFSRLLSRSRARSAARRVPDLVGSSLPSPYHFPARIQSFQAVAAPFPGDSVFKSERFSGKFFDKNVIFADRKSPSSCPSKPP